MTTHTFANDDDRQAFGVAFAAAVGRGRLTDDAHDRDAFASVWSNNRRWFEADDDTSRKTCDALELNAKVLGGIARDGGTVPTTAAQTAATSRTPAFEHVVDDNDPPGLDKEASALHDQVIAHMRGSRFDYFRALADLAKVPDLDDWSDAPPRAAFEEGIVAVEQWIAKNPALAGEGRDALADAQAQLAEHMRTLLTLRREGVSYLDARGLMEAQDRVAALEAEYAELDTSDVPWRNTSKLAELPQPWSDDHWQRDQRRADAGGVDMLREAWEAAATQGEDLARTLISEARENELGAAKSRLAAEREDGRARAAARRAEALTKVLDERAQERVRQAQERRTRTV
jgi:hypothetical protein